LPCIVQHNSTSRSVHTYAQPFVLQQQQQCSRKKSIEPTRPPVTYSKKIVEPDDVGCRSFSLIFPIARYNEWFLSVLRTYVSQQSPQPLEACPSYNRASVFTNSKQQSIVLPQ
ncbi:unnamed protein product, partial [Laminaria digitata]